MDLHERCQKLKETSAALFPCKLALKFSTMAMSTILSSFNLIKFITKGFYKAVSILKFTLEKVQKYEDKRNKNRMEGI
jgi:hypothetical protein